jgi:hypothetical protein
VTRDPLTRAIDLSAKVLTSRWSACCWSSRPLLHQPRHASRERQPGRHGTPAGSTLASVPRHAGRQQRRGG